MTRERGSGSRAGESVHGDYVDLHRNAAIARVIQQALVFEASVMVGHGGVQ